MFDTFRHRILSRLSMSNGFLERLHNPRYTAQKCICCDTWELVPKEMENFPICEKCFPSFLMGSPQNSFPLRFHLAVALFRAGPMNKRKTPCYEILPQETRKIFFSMWKKALLSLLFDHQYSGPEIELCRVGTIPCRENSQNWWNVYVHPKKPGYFIEYEHPEF